MKNRPLLLIDLVGTLVVSAIVGGVGWYAFIKPDTASSQMFALTEEVSQLQNEQLQLQGMLDVRTARRQELLASAEGLGRLPDESPIDQDLNKIVALANRNHVKILEVAPVSTIRYPNILELRYRIKTEGSFRDHVGFLQSYEACSFWSDMAYLSVGPVAVASAIPNPTRRSELTVSFFSSYQ